MRQFASCVLGFALVFATQVSFAVTYTVITAEDSSFACTTGNECDTLRGALTKANQTSETDTILFKIDVGDSAVKTISLLTELPDITSPVIINGFSQTDAVRNTNSALNGLNSQLMIELDGNLLNVHAGLHIRAGNSIIEGMVIKNFRLNAGILLENGGNNIIRGNFIGTNADGMTKAPNGNGIQIWNSANNSIGDALSIDARNLISANLFDGITISGTPSSGNKVEANLIGTNITGNVELGNKASGILLTSPEEIESYASNNVIGGVGAKYRNIISGNDEAGIKIFRGATNTVASNYIGLNVGGDQKLPNGADGIHISEGSTNNIGGVDSNYRNVISGNVGNGIKLDAGFHVTVSGSLPKFQSDAIKNIIRSNYIGTDASGMTAVPNKGGGILIKSNNDNNFGVDGTRIGDDLDGGNLISGNGDAGIGGAGITLDGKKTANTIVEKNIIGLASDGTTPLGNESHGVWIKSGSSDNLIGSTNDHSIGFPPTDYAANKIAFNGGGHLDAAGDPAYNTPDTTIGLGLKGHGVFVEEGTKNRIRLNNIYSNEGRGIDLGDDQTFTLNDVLEAEAPSLPDVSFDDDDGANDLQNYPVAIKVTFASSDKTISWMLHSQPDDYTIDFYANDEPDKSGFGEGKRYLGTETINVLAFNNTYKVSEYGAYALGARGQITKRFQLTDKNISATATDAAGNTSEFSMVDTDGDALADSWEFKDQSTVYGIDVNEDGKIDFQPIGGTRFVKDIYVEIDSMLLEEPSDDVISRIQTAFITVPNGLVNNADEFGGIYLNLNKDESGLTREVWIEGAPEFGRLKNGAPGGDHKDGHFGTVAERGNSNWKHIRAAKRLVYHYMVMALAEREDDSALGTGESGDGLGGNDTRITLGLVNSQDLEEQQASTIMHEFGHNLGLGHGGNDAKWGIMDSRNFKPNYRSLMSYTWSSEAFWMREDVNDNSTIDDEERLMNNEGLISDNIWRLDYSHRAFNELNEAALDETVGIGGDPSEDLNRNGILDEGEDRNNNGIIDQAGWTRYGPNTKRSGAQRVLETGPVDWNRDGLKTTGVKEARINNIWGSDVDVVEENLVGRSDWSNLRYYFIESPQFNEKASRKPADPEMTLGDILESNSFGPGPGAVSFVKRYYSVNEGDGSASIGVARGGGTHGTITVDYSVTPISADAGVDYTPVTATLSFAEGEYLKTFDVPILNDGVDEGTETALLTLSNPTGRAVVYTGQGESELRIEDDDGSGTLQFSAPYIDVNETDGVVNIEVTRATGIDGAVTVDYFTADDTATGGQDYVVTSGTLSFASGQATAGFSVTILSDLETEITERVSLTLANPTGGVTLGDYTAVNLNIFDVPVTAGLLQFSNASYDAIENATNATITVERTLTTAGAVSVDYATSDGSATAGNDYSPVSGTLNFFDGQASATFNVPLIDDILEEGNENLVMTLSNATGGASIFSALQAELIIIDDEGAGTLQFSTATQSFVEGDNTVTIDVLRVGGTDGAVSVDFRSEDDTAMAGSDYTGINGTLNFADGETTASFNLLIREDEDGEGDETLKLILSNPAMGAELGEPSTVTLTITDNETPIVVTNANDTGGGSLRWAITSANARLGADIITFNIPGDGVHTISIGEVERANLPSITESVIIDGYSQPGSQVNTSLTGSNAVLKIELEGSQNPDRSEDGRTLLIGNGLKLRANNSVIRGLAINRVLHFAVDVSHGSFGNQIVGNYLGTDSTGTRSFLDLFQHIGDGIFVTSDNPGPTNDNWGIQHLAVRIGVGANNNVIGGASPADRNILSGLEAGITINVGFNNRVQGNLIGVAADGSSPLPNLVGILEYYHNRTVPTEPNLDTTVIGGIAPGEGNVIAHNWRYGVENRSLKHINAITHSTIRGNSFFNNGPLLEHFTDLYGPRASNVTSLNDRPRYGPAIAFVQATGVGQYQWPVNFPLDSDGTQNYPVLNSVVTSLGSSVVAGSLNSKPNQLFSIDIYANPANDNLRFNEGKTYLGSTLATTNEEGNATFIFNLGRQLSPGQLITATATGRYTSMFSTRIMVGDTLVSPFVVNTTDDIDNGICDQNHCSLREAIHAANNHPGEDQIHFAIGSGLQTIAVPIARELPPILEPVVIDGSTQPGFIDSPIIELTGDDGDEETDLPIYGLRLYGGHSTIRGLAINGMEKGIFAPFSWGLRRANTDGFFSHPGAYQIEGNYIGLNMAGDTAVPNEEAGIYLYTADNIIGGMTPEQRNVISGNRFGIVLNPKDARSEDSTGGGSQILGNYIGTDPSGNLAIGNTGAAINLEALGSGSSDIGHVGHVIGGVETGAGNVISGNNNGIQISAGTGHRIQGNFIGTNADGTSVLGNTFAGIALNYGDFGSGSGDSLIGGADEAARNIISGSSIGVFVRTNPFNDLRVQIQGNYIGTDVTGTLGFANFYGIQLQGNGHIVGGSEPGEGNLISANTIGIRIARDNHQIVGNLMGTTADGLGALGDDAGNSGTGILCYDRSAPTGVTIGGSEPGSGNVIANFTGDGISCGSGSRIAILGNSIHSNGQHGIDLGADGRVPANDVGDVDVGVNNLQNYPDISLANVSAGVLTVSGSLSSMPETTYRMEFFSNSVVDDTETDPGYGEGEHFLGAASITTDSIGDGAFAETFSALPGQFISATATDPDGNTSEFAKTVAITGVTNASPVAQNDDVVTAQATSITIDILANDEDPDGDLDPATVVVKSGPSNGATDVSQTTGAVTYTPTSLFSGGDSFQYTVKDTLGAVSNISTVSVTVLPPSNLPPVANAGMDLSGGVGDTVQLNGAASDDPEGDSITYRWSLILVPVGSTAVLSNATSSTPSLTLDQIGVYTAQLIVNDGKVDSAADTAQITALDLKPVADAGPDQNVEIGTAVTLDGRGSSDPEGAPLTYQWLLSSKPPGSAAQLTNALAVNSGLVVDVVGTYIAELVVNNGEADSSSDSVAITVIDSNTLPVADAGPDQDGLVDGIIILDGSGSLDADGDALTYSWLLLSAPSGSVAAISDASVVSPTITVDLKGEYELELTVNDGAEDSLSDTMIISIGNTAPLADAGADQLVGPGDTATLDGSGSTDADGDALTYSWAVTGQPAGSIATLSEMNAVMPTLLIDELGTYTIELVVKDGVTDSLPDEVDLESVNVAPVANAGSDQSVVVGQRVQLDGSSSSDADGDELSYSWIIIDSPEGSGAVLSDASSAMTELDIDVFGNYTIQLVVNDGVEESEPDTMLLNTINTLPVADAGSDQSVYVGETVVLDGSGSSDADSNPLTFSWSLTQQPAASLAVLMDETTVSPLIVIDEQGTYVIQLIVNDGNEDSLPDTVLLNVGNVRPIADAGPDQAASVFSTVTLDGSGSSDADNDLLTYNWSIINAPAGNASVFPDSGIVDPTLDVDLEGDYILQLIVNDGTVDSDADSLVVNAQASSQDGDGDGVLDDHDLCENTVVPETTVPTKKLGVNRWALIDDDNLFDTKLPKGVGPQRSFTTEETHGCSCEQIIERLHLGAGHTKFGCSIGVMDNWVRSN
jgi:CSLREA domain-containing protein